MLRSARSTSLAVFLFTAMTLGPLGCTRTEPEPQPASQDKSGQAAKAQQPAAPSIKASQDDCVGPLTHASKPREISFGDWRFKLDGYELTQLNKDPDEEIVVGVLSDTKENTEENQKNLDQILDFFDREKVQVIVHLGDIASTTPMPDDMEVPDKDEQGNPLSAEQKNRIRRRLYSKARRESMKKSYEDIVEMISILAETERPVFVISGNRECKTTFNSAMATLAEDFPNVFNMNMIRLARLDDLDIISMPGYHDPEYVHCPWDKCLYYESDTLSLIDLAKQADSEVLLISHGPPRQDHNNGIDVVSEGANVGNPALTAAIRKAKIFFGAFGNIQEAGGKATNLEGSEIVPQDTFVSSLFLNPGPADSMVWTMNDGTESHGMAAVLHFVGKKAKYVMFRVGEEKKSAQAPADEGAQEKQPAGEEAPAKGATH